MPNNKIIKVFWFLIFAFSLISCSDKTETKSSSSESDKPVILVVNYPLEYFAKRIGGDLVDVKFPAPANEDPAYWQPDTEIIEDYQKADIILLNGADYAKWVRHVSLPPSKMVDTSVGFKDSFIEIPDAVTHSHGPSSKHAHGNIAFTTWLDFAQAAQHARSIKSVFIKLNPENEKKFEDNFNLLEHDLLDLDQQMQNVASKIMAKPLIASHPVYQYFSRRYKLNIKSLHWEPDEYPPEENWKELEKLQQELSTVLMIWEDKPLPKIFDRLKIMGIDSITFNPCSNRTEEGDFMYIMKKNIESLRLTFAHDIESKD
jgi:zinc transport system substrate-binding protein